MKRLPVCLAALALLWVQAVASAQVTYNFTGVVTGADGSPPISVAAGDIVTGTFTVTPVGDVSTTANFSGGGFSQTATVAGIAWPSGNSSGPQSSGVGGTFSPNAAPNTAVWAFNASEYVDQSANNEESGGASAELAFASTTTPAWTTTGLPVFSTGVSATGNFGFAWAGGYCCGDYQVNYVVTSMAPANGPTATISVAPAHVSSGKSFTLTWSSTNASSCTASGEGSGPYTWSGPVSDSGSLVMQAQPGAFTFWVFCSDVAGLIATAQASLSSPPTVTFTTSNAQPAVGQSFTLTWSSAGANACTSTANGPNGISFWNGAVALSGTLAQSWATAGEYNYILYCTQGPMQVIRSVQVNVGAAAPAGASTSPPSGHGGGGALGVFELLCLALVLSALANARVAVAA